MAEPLKNLYSKTFVTQLAHKLAEADKSVNSNKFVAAVFDNTWEQKELKQRTRHITVVLNQFLPYTYTKQIEVLTAIAAQFKGYPAVLFPDFVEVYGLNNLKVSIKALEYFTQFSTSEFAIRAFIIKYPKQMLDQHLKWAKHKNQHVRRLASEGIRPRLPWAIALPDFKSNPYPILPILALLKTDESEYVRRSVANCLNDISKDNPDVLLDILNQWHGNNPLTDGILKHAARGLLKKGNNSALEVFGLSKNVKVVVNQFGISAKTVAIGSEFSFNFQVQLNQNVEAKVRLEYRIYFAKQSGKQLPKIFMIGTYIMQQNKLITITKTHKFANLTTRKHYAGEHKITLVVNGKDVTQQVFYLKESS